MMTKIPKIAQKGYSTSISSYGFIRIIIRILEIQIVFKIS